MRIVLVGPVDPYRGGIAHFTTALANAASRAHTVEVVSFRRLYPAFLYPGQSDRDPSRRPFPLEARASFLIDPLNPFTWMAAARHIARARPDVVVLPWWTTYLGPCLGSLARLLRGQVPVVYLVHNVLPHEPRLFDRGVARWALRAGQGFVVLTDREEGRLARLLPDRARIVVCRHPVYRQFASDRVDPGQARRRLGIPLAPPLVLFFGFVRPYKGVEFLIEAMAQLGDRGHPATLIIAGEIWHGGKDLLRRVKSRGMTNRVRIDDRYIPNEEVGLYFSAADVFVAPYTAGTQSGSLQIAVDFSLPVVVTEQLVSGLDGVPPDRSRVVPAGDAAALADAIESILQIPRREGRAPLEDDGWDALTAALVDFGESADGRDV